MKKYWEFNRELGFPKKLIKMTQLCVGRSKSKVKVGQNFSDVFEVYDDLKRSDVLSSTLLFNIGLVYITRKSEIRPAVTVF